MKSKLFVLLAVAFGLSACSASVSYNQINVDDSINSAQKTGELSDFDLISPGNELVLETVTEFKWSESTNAEKYTLEICSSEGFQSDIETVDYYKKDNIVGTSFNIKSQFAYMDTVYYWRVTAKNSSKTKQSTSTFKFTVKAPSFEEVKFDLGEADDWKLHNAGSKADIAIDNSNFFGDGEKALKLTFDKKDTKRGIEESDGWFIVTKTVEKSTYGTDALYFNSFYAGDDARILIRLVDRDNEYWYCPIQMSLGAKQTVILKFDEFVQRYEDVTVANEKFNYERIKYMEVVFERSFGSGFYFISGVKAVRYADYRQFFIDKLNFSDYDESRYSTENYNFDYTIVDNYELVLNYYGEGNDLGKDGIKGYGFVKVKVDRYMAKGNAVRVSVKYSGKKGSNVVIRVYEEDTDRWSYLIPFDSLSTEEYTTLTIPYEAFGKSETLGDGRRQFYRIINLQFGLQGEDGTGELRFKDFEVVTVGKEEKREIGENGLIDDFNNYVFNTEMYSIWTSSTDNKDEYMTLNRANKVGGTANPATAQFEYKTDMEPAIYTLPIKVSNNFSSLSLLLKDNSSKSGDSRVANDDSYDYRPTVGLVIVSNGDRFIYYIDRLDRQWYEYDIPFAEFKEYGLEEDKESTKTIDPLKITSISIAVQFFYKDSNNKAMPLYAQSNPIWVDNIYFKYSTVKSITLRETVVTMNGKTALLDDFEGYSDSQNLMYSWFNANTHEYQLIELSNEVSSQGGAHSMALQFKTKSNSPSYAITPAFASDVLARGIKVSLKSTDVKAEVYINFYMQGGAQYRATLKEVETEWTEYTIGLDCFFKLGTTDNGLTRSDIVKIQKITFGIVYSGGTEYLLKKLYVDNFIFDYNMSDYSADPNPSSNPEHYQDYRKAIV